MNHAKQQYGRPQGKKYEYDPKFNKKKYFNGVKIQHSEKHLGNNVYNGQNKNYLGVIKSFFGGGKELRDFLIENNIVEIVQI